jgi:acetyltransferase
MVKALPVIDLINSIRHRKPLLQTVMPLPEFWEEYRLNSKYKIPLFRNPEDPAVVLSNMFNFKSASNNTKRLKPGKSDQIITSGTPGFIPEDKISELTKRYNIPAASSVYLKHEQIKNAELSFPIVLKASGKGIIHKTELNAVRLNIKSKEELLQEADKMIKDFKDKNLNIESFLIQPYIKMKHEILIGGFRDNDFGPMVMFGSGGKYVEVFEDTAMRSAYLTEHDIDNMISETKMGKILSGVRGESPVDMVKVKSVIKSVAQMMLDYESITELDLNPLIVDENNKLFAVDIRIKAG